MIKNILSRFFQGEPPATTQEPPIPASLTPFSELKLLVETYNQKVQPPAVFCMGDSVWERISRDDVDPRNVGQMLGDSLKHTTEIAFISHSAYNLRIYLNFIKALAVMRNRPEYVVLPINLRSFSPQWFLNPLWQFERENQVLQDYCLDPEMDIPTIEPVVEYPGIYKEFDETAVKFPLSEYQAIREFRKQIASVPVNDDDAYQRLRQIFIFHYMHPLVEEHLLLKCLDEALQKLSGMNIKTFVYITPINHQAGLRFCGKDFLTQVAANTTLIYEVINRHQTNGMNRYMDYGTLLDSEYFFNLDNATEHLNEYGRKFLVEKMKEELISLMDERKGE
jgi:hypothetical protein